MTITLGALTLPDELIWVDEFTWSAIDASKEATIGNKVIVSESAVIEQKGRPITLSGEGAWAERSNVVALWNMYQEIGLEQVLTLHDGQTFNVRFRHWDAPAFSADSLTGTAYNNDGYFYVITLKLVVI